jgi:DNA replication protein DnaC
VRRPRPPPLRAPDQGRRVPPQLVEAADDKQLTKAINRDGRVDLLCGYELGYMELDRRGAELLFQVLTEREEKASVAIASNESLAKAHMFRATCARRHLN